MYGRSSPSSPPTMSQGSSCPGSSLLPPQHLGKFGWRTGFGLVTCPRCGAEVIELLSNSTKNPGKIFFKCCLNVVDDPTTCKFYMWSEHYKKWLDAGCPVGPTAPRSFQSNMPSSSQLTETSNIHGLQMATAELKDGLAVVEKYVEVLKNGLGSIKEEVAQMKSFGKAVDGKMEKMVSIGQFLVASNVVVAVVVCALVVKMFY